MNVAQEHGGQRFVSVNGWEEALIEAVCLTTPHLQS